MDSGRGPESAARQPVRPAVAILRLIERGNWGPLVRWFAAGIAFMGISTALLYLLVDMMRLTVPVATFLTAEACTLLRFFVNHYWVFGARSPTWRQCLGYHVANAGAFVVWWSAANALTLIGVHYLVAGIGAVAFSTLFSLFTNFFWIWAKRH